MDAIRAGLYVVGALGFTTLAWQAWHKAPACGDDPRRQRLGQWANTSAAVCFWICFVLVLVR